MIPVFDERGRKYDYLDLVKVLDDLIDEYDIIVSYDDDYDSFNLWQRFKDGVRVSRKQKKIVDKVIPLKRLKELFINADKGREIAEECYRKLCTMENIGLFSYLPKNIVGDLRDSYFSDIRRIYEVPLKKLRDFVTGKRKQKLLRRVDMNNPYLYYKYVESQPRSEVWPGHYNHIEVDKKTLCEKYKELLSSISYFLAEHGDDTIIDYMTKTFSELERICEWLREEIYILESDLGYTSSEEERKDDKVNNTEQRRGRKVIKVRTRKKNKVVMLSDILDKGITSATDYYEAYGPFTREQMDLCYITENISIDDNFACYYYHQYSEFGSSAIIREIRALDKSNSSMYLAELKKLVDKLLVRAMASGIGYESFVKYIKYNFKDDEELTKLILSFVTDEKITQLEFYKYYNILKYLRTHGGKKEDIEKYENELFKYTKKTPDGNGVDMNDVIRVELDRFYEMCLEYYLRVYDIVIKDADEEDLSFVVLATRIKTHIVACNLPKDKLDELEMKAKYEIARRKSIKPEQLVSGSSSKKKK